MLLIRINDKSKEILIEQIRNISIFQVKSESYLVIVTNDNSYEISLGEILEEMALEIATGLSVQLNNGCVLQLDVEKKELFLIEKTFDKILSRNIKEIIKIKK